jgi:hypothetical protein
LCGSAEGGRCYPGAAEADRAALHPGDQPFQKRLEAELEQADSGKLNQEAAQAAESMADALAREKLKVSGPSACWDPPLLQCTASAQGTAHSRAAWFSRGGGRCYPGAAEADRAVLHPTFQKRLEAEPEKVDRSVSVKQDASKTLVSVMDTDGRGRLFRATAIAAGGGSEEGHTCACLSDGSAVCWGSNTKGQVSP